MKKRVKTQLIGAGIRPLAVILNGFSKKMFFFLL